MSVVETETFKENVSNASALLKNGWGILLQGQGSSGKTLLANELARSHGVVMKTINVDDTFDSKDLLGKFSATDVPGVFEWAAGPVTEAVTKGQWLLMEDIDLASFDVFSVLLPLITSGSLFLSDKGKTIDAHPSFRLIATQQLMEFGSNVLSTKKMNSIPNVETWSTVIVKVPTTDEKLTIVSTLYPTVPLEPLTQLLEQIPVRYCGLRDVLKWSHRVFKQVDAQKQGGFLSSTIREVLFQEAYDCFCAGFPLSAERDNLIISLANCCGIPVPVAQSIINERKPQLNVTREVLQIGRISLPTAGPVKKRDAVVAFAETKQSMCLMERLACAAANNEAVLLTGETGVGKTFLVQYLADNLGQSLIVHNLNQQTDSSDFMGGWKPRDMSQQIRVLYNKFVPLFKASFNWQKNSGFLDSISMAVEHRNWDAALVQFEKGCRGAKASLQGEDKADLCEQWNSFSLEMSEIQAIVQAAKTSFLFVFEEGTLVKAWREGHWILLDEVNLASTEVLERVASVLGGSDTLIVTERGSTEEVPRHPNFRVFANMNPPTDVGKKDLPPSLRSRFTEFYVPDPFDRHDLTIVVSTYLAGLNPDAKVNEIVNFFLECVASARSTLCDLDGESKPPHFSLRSLTRALTYIRRATSMYGFNTSILDGLMMSFASPLQRKFHKTIQDMLVRIIFHGRAPNMATLPKQPPGADPSKKFIPYEHIWLELGPVEPFINEKFILTHTVKDHLKNIARAVFTKRPVLLEGPTSAGKSSMVQYLAEMTGHHFVRINNHESTEIQEYLGHYVSDESGKLRFVDGCLTAAVRHGHWVVLDELNLAPTEVLEALNRLLDDNCELFVPDTQETIQPHPSLRIFATQNPSGIYGGRKALSRAFRNRFLEIIVDDIPTKEIQEILCKRYSMPPKFAEKMVEVMTMLQIRRQSSHLFAGRHGYITPRDLFRWADRHAMDYQTLADHGYLLLGERCRKPDEKRVVKDVIEKCMNVIIEDDIYDPKHWEFTAKYFKLVDDVVKEKIVWTPSMQRLFTIVGLCLEHKEPVLLVGETGSSKTTICQIWATVLNQTLQIVNCHQHSEASDFLGSLRPTPQDQESDSLFDWQDGPLVRSMRRGDIFVLDEISLAEDSVLERLNSVLEPSRTLTLAEKSTGELLTADEAFRFLATMNPGGDFGKKELSPALRNRFTEVYVQPITSQNEIAQIICKRLPPLLHSYASHMARLLLAVAERKMDSVIHISIRDVIGWADFMSVTHERCDPDVAFWHGLDAILLDGLSVGGGVSEASVETIRTTCLSVAKTLVPKAADTLKEPFWNLCAGTSEPRMPTGQEKRFFFGAPTTRGNASKLIRASVLKKAIMLEGSPGVGKTSIVEALGAAFEKTVVRINLSEQTDMMDLLGAFLPCASSTSEGPSFEWSDGILLNAVKMGHWVILDELNLASQSVLEGLNALLDHRSTIFLPELCKEVTAHPDFRLFACQNPLVEGGGRKGLPKSFLNRFTKVRVAPFHFDDLMCIATACTDLPDSLIEKMVQFACKLQQSTMELRSFGSRGSPWEFNLRDVLRWSKLMLSAKTNDPRAFADMLFFQRFRTAEDQAAAVATYNSVFCETEGPLEFVDFHIKNGYVMGGHMPIMAAVSDVPAKMPLILACQTTILNSVLWCAASNQFCVLIGPAASGKSSILSMAARMVGATLDVFSMTAGCDTMDLLGGFDQVEGRQGSFEWRDSVILKAMIEGHWVVLDNANFCSASVLDRLNSLVEPNGVLVVNEQGLVNGEVRIVRPHPNFRLFATMDPKFGEMSRALRNRSVELFVAPPSIPSQDASVLAFSNNLDAPQGLIDNINQFHHQFVLSTAFADTRRPLEGRLSDALAAGAPTLVTLLRALKLSSGTEDPAAALFSSYIRNRSGVWTVHREKVEEHLRGINFDTLTSAISNEALIKASQLREGSLEVALLLAAAFRAALVFFCLKGEDEQASEASWDGALMHFVQNASGSGALTSLIIQELVDMGVPFTNVEDVKSLLSRGDNSMNVVVHSDMTIGRSSRALRLPCHSSVPSNVSEAIEDLFKAISTQFDLLVIEPISALRLLAYVRPVLIAFHGRELTPTTKAMLPLLTYVSLTLQTIVECGDDALLRQAATSAFSALRRYANLAGDMAPPPALLLAGQPQAKDANSLAIVARDEQALEEFNARRSVAETSLYILWRQAATRQEVRIMSLISRCLTMDHTKVLEPLLNGFDAIFTGKVPLLPKGIMLGVSIDLACPPIERLSGISEMISMSSFRKSESAQALIPGSWIGSACKALRLANAATLGDFCDFSRSTTSQVLAYLRSSLEPSVLSPIDGFSVVREWLSADVEWLLKVLDDGNHEPSPSLSVTLTRVCEFGKDKKLASFRKDLENVISIVEDSECDLVTLLKACIVFNAVKCQLLTPSSFVDPMLSYQLGKVASQEEVAYWSAALKITQMGDAVSFGLTQASALTKSLKRVAADFVSQDALMQQKYTPRPDETGVRFVELVTTQNDLCKGMLSENRLGVCLRFIEEFTNVQSPTKRTRSERVAVSREEVESWCQLMRTSANELYHRFRGYEDFILPFAHSLTLVAFFTETALQAIPSGAASYLQGDEASALIEFPCPRPVLVHPPLDINDRFGDLAKLLDSTLKETRIQAATGFCKPGPIFDALSHVYAAVEELNRSELHQDELAVLYKEKAIVIEGDDEKNIRRLKEMFPEYEKEFDDLDKEQPEEEEADTDARTKKMGHTARVLFNGDNGQRLRQIPQIHREIYQLLTFAKESTDGGKEKMESFESRFDAVASLQRGFFTCHANDELKTISGCLARAKVLQQKITEARPVAAVDIEKLIESSFNIYLDCVPSESSMVAKHVNDLSMAIQKLVFEYPDNVTLLRIMKIIRRLQEYPAFSTPLMRIVAATEILLRECYEWERNASRDVSLLAHINALSGCVLRWRRMELHCWPHIFNAKENEFTSRASAKWFELYRYTQQIATNSIEFDPNASFSYASDFMWNCCIGEFETRLSLLEAFGLQLIHDYTNDSAITLGTIFLHISGFFTQFRALVQTTIENVRAPLRDDLEEFCRIMRWEDATYYAVRSSTQRSHLKISRVLISLEEGLRQPILQVITKHEEEAFEQNLGFTMTTAPLKAKEKEKKNKKSDKKDDAKKEASKRNRKGKKLEKEEADEEPVEDVVTTMHKNHWSCADLLVAGDYLEDSRENIVERIMVLQAPKVPQNQKSRALKLLFESTEEAGIPQTHEATLPEWHVLFSAGALPPSLLTESKFARAFADPAKGSDLRLHFYKLSRTIQKMRDCQRTPHNDITAGQVNRGTGMAETLFADVAFLHRGISELAMVKDGLSSILMSVDKSSSDFNPIYRGNSASLIRKSRSMAMWLLTFVSQAEWLDSHKEMHAVEMAAKELLQFADQYFYHVSKAGYELSKTEYAVLQGYLSKCECALAPVAALQTGIGSQAAGFVADIRLIRAAPTKASSDELNKWRDEVTSLMKTLTNLFQCLPPSSPVLSLPPPAKEKKERADGESSDASGDEFPTTIPVVKHGRDAYATILLNISAAKSELHSLITKSNASHTLTGAERTRLLAQVRNQLAVVDAMAFFLHQWTERVSHFSMVIAKVMIALMKKGFCKSEEEEEDQDGDGGAGENKEGTGMDDGKGEKDVTDELENEDQLMNMKDKEQQENDDDEKEGEDKDKAAEVETDFQADKEDRSDDEEDDDDGDDSDAEMGSVDEENQQERKKSRKEKDDPDMNEDEGGNAEEVPEDDLAQEKEKDEEGEEGDEETKDYGNKEKEIKDAASDAEKDEDNAELIGDNDSQQFSDSDDDESAKSGDDEKEKENSDADDKSVASEIDDDASGDGADEERQGSDEDSDADPDRQEEADLDNPNATEDGDAESTDDDDADDKETEHSKIKDQNSQYTGEQDDEAGDEETTDKEKKTEKHDDAAGAENEEQTGNEQEKNDAGRSWKKKDQNEQSQKSSSDQKKQTNDANPMKALKEAMKRHTQKAKQLNLDRQVKLNEDNTNDDHNPQDDENGVEDDDDFEIHEKGMDEGMAPTDDVNPSAADATLPDQANSSDEEDEDDNAEPSDAPQDKKTRRKKEEDEVEIEEGEAKDKDSKKDKDKKKSKKLQLTAKEDEEESEAEELNEEAAKEEIDEKAQRGRDLWYSTEAVVAGHAQNLCEQLRLILAPTQADKLQGDYKTGKRINIKKIIPYIASQFKKDRIWLRRTKPNKRSYQVLIALDDSLSMLKNNAGVVSCQAVALLSKAMQQLEVGEFGILRFGKETTIVHPLVEAFAADSGPRAFAEFTFEQQSTSMRTLLETSLDYMDMEKSRLSGAIRSTTQTLRQMLFIVSDGQITEDRNALRKLLARAEENGQAVVLLILDIAAYDPTASTDAATSTTAAAAAAAVTSPTNANEKGFSLAEKMRRHNSARDARLKKSLKGVLDMQVVEFQGTKVLKKAYLEDFPFPFYIVVQDIPSLPTMLADAMRQWFELLANGQ